MMMPSHSTPNLQQTGVRSFENNNIELIHESQTTSSFFPYIQNQSKSSDLNFSSVETSSILRGDYDSGGSSSPPAPPVRDASSLKNTKYGPGHEKFPSWPVAAAIETPQVLRGPPSGGSHRSKSWTDHTNYPKEKVMTYSRPYMKRPNSQQKLKTVLERCEKNQPETFELKHGTEMDVVYMPKVDREGKALGDLDYMVPSPPERDLNNKSNHQLSQKELEEYARSYQDHQQAYQVQQLTQADLEKYTRSYEEALAAPQHQKQPSYAQSEGYHSYVSSTDSMSTPFLDRLRRDSEAVLNRTTTTSSEAGNTNNWDESPERERDNDVSLKSSREGRDSVVTTSSGSVSSSETLKWHGSISDVSVASSSCTHNNSSRQLIAHSARVQTPQRHNSESVLYIGPPSEYKNADNYENSGGVSWREHEIRNNHQNKLKLFAVNTYTVQPSEQSSGISMNSSSSSSQLSQQNFQRSSAQSISQSSLSVADRVSELERHQTRYTYLDPDKKHKVSDPTLKAIQKKALLSFYERHHAGTPNKQNSTSWRSEPQLTQPYPKTQSPPPQPPPRPKARPASRRASSASDYSKTSWLESVKKRSNEMKEFPPRHQHSNSCGSLSNDLLGPVIMGPSISIDDWVPERPPKNPHLRTAFPDLFQERRVASPDLPPPSPPTVLETEVINNDEPFPPPPPEIEAETWSNCDLPNYDQSIMYQNRQRSEQNPYRQVDDRHFSESNIRPLKTDDKHPDSRQPTYSPPKCLDIPSQLHRNVATRNSDMRIAERRHSRPNSVQLSTPERKHIFKSPRSIEEASSKRSPAFVRSTSYEKDPIVGFATHRQIKIPSERASMRHPSTQKLIINGKISVAVSQKVHNDPAVSGQFRAEPLRSHQILRSHDSNQRAESTSLDQENFRPRTQSFIENGSQNNAPLLQPRLSKTYQSMRQISTSQQQENIPLTKYYAAAIRKSALKKEKNNDELIHGKPSINNSNHLNQSKTSSYLSYRGNRERDPQETEYGSYKRILSSGSNKSLECTSTTTECEHKKWSSNYVHKTAMISIESTTETSESQIVTRNNNNNSLLQRLNQNDEKEQVKQNETTSSIETSTACSHTACNLPDVLPVSAKLSPPLSLSLSKSPSYRSLSSNESPKSPKAYTSPNLSPKAISLNTSQQSSSLGSSSPTSTTGFPSLEKRLSVSSSSSTTPSLNLLPSDFLISKSPIISPLSCPEIKFSSSLVVPPDPIEDQSSVSINKHTISEGTSTSLDTNSIENSAMSQVTEGLQLIQRTEVVLRVNACTTDTASQTDLQRDVETSPSPTTVFRTPLLTPRCKLQEEIDCDQLSRDLANQLSPSDRLKGILAPAPDQKKSTDYVSGLFKLEVTRPRTTTGINRSVETEVTQSQLIKEKKPSAQKLFSATYTESSSPLSPTSTYFTTSEPKAKFLTQYSRDMAQFSRMQDTKGLNQKKEELMYRLDKKLEVLRSEQLAVGEESRINESLGNQVSDHITRVARPQEIAKYRLHVEEVGKITSLLLGLSGRLARAENALMGLPSDHLERKILENKRDKLQDQLEEAKKLKENIDKRSVNVSNILHKYLNDEEYGDYDHFINMKAKLIMDAREIADKIKLGEEQLTALRETLNIKID